MAIEYNKDAKKYGGIKEMLEWSRLYKYTEIVKNQVSSIVISKQ